LRRENQLKSPAEKLFDKIENRGWKGRMVPVGHVADLREAICGSHQQGLFDEAVYQELFSFFSFDPPVELPGAKSIIIVAVPTPQVRLTFHWQGGPRPVVTPPTYVNYARRTKDVQTALAGWLKEEGYGLAGERLPLKTLAVCSGLGEYGRPNICFVPGMGSFLQLVGAFTDLPCDSDPWREPKALALCETCKACRKSCPTGAIPEDRFLIRAERCLTYHNEAAADFPGWIDPSWHHCLVGCMRCQTACPENRGVLDWFEDRGEFSEHETNLLMERVSFDRLPALTQGKLKSLELNEEYVRLCRNLSMVLSRNSQPTG
jgi:epoxyqueuosine reductase